MDLLQDALSEKVGFCVASLSAFVTGLIIAFIKHWKLAFIMLSGTVAMIMCMGGLGAAMKATQAKVAASTAASSTLAEEAVASIRNVTAFGMQERIAKQYERDEKKSRALDMKAKALLGLMIATTVLLFCLIYALAFWQGGRFMRWGQITVAEVLIVLLASLMGGISIGHAA